MARLIIVALLSLIIGVAVGYAFAHQKQTRLRNESGMTLVLHQELAIASIAGKSFHICKINKTARRLILCD
ncbi:hypothetical protein L0244_10395 [bacterium]|nr:hypothetical protein [bacterium]MCI0613390.1 hypothetical protein [bacterium]